MTEKELEKLNKIISYDFEGEELTVLKDRLEVLHDDLCNEKKYHAAGYLSVDISNLDKRLNPEKYK